MLEWLFRRRSSPVRGEQGRTRVAQDRGSGRRALDAAAGGRRWAAVAPAGNLNADLQALGTVRGRAGYLARNNPWASRATDALVSNLIGGGLRPQSKHPDRATRQRLERLFDHWEPDATTFGSFAAAQALAVRSMIESGEALIRIRRRVPENGLAVPLQLQALDPSQLDAFLHRDLGNGRQIVSGVEFDPLDRPAAYWIRRHAPGAPFVTSASFEPVRVAGDEILHMFAPLAAGQVRGLPWLAPVLARLATLDRTEDAQAVRQETGALLTGFVIDAGGTAAGFDGQQSGSDMDVSLEPGVLRVLQPGQDIRFSEPPETGQYHDFVKQQLRAIAACMGLTYEQLTGDMTGVNYSSARVSLSEARRRFKQIQELVIVPQLCRPVWRAFVDAAVLAGQFAPDPDLYACRWQAEAWEHVDPLKAVAADVEAVAAGFKSRSQVIAEHGQDAEDLDEERAEDAARATRLGLQETASADRNPQAAVSADDA